MERKDLYIDKIFKHNITTYQVIKIKDNNITIKELDGVFKGDTQTLTINSLLYSLNRV